MSDERSEHESSEVSRSEHERSEVPSSPWELIRRQRGAQQEQQSQFDRRRIKEFLSYIEDRQISYSELLDIARCIAAKLKELHEDQVAGLLDEVKTRDDMRNALAWAIDAERLCVALFMLSNVEL